MSPPQGGHPTELCPYGCCEQRTCVWAGPCSLCGQRTPDGYDLPDYGFVNCCDDHGVKA